MKIKQGFVSNSSTTAFCLYGVPKDLEDLLNENEEYRQLFLEHEDHKQALTRLCNKYGLDCELDPTGNYEFAWIGINPTFDRYDNWTLKDLKHETESRLKTARLKTNYIAWQVKGFAAY